MTTFKNNNQGCLWALIGGTIFLLLKSIILFLFWKWFISGTFEGVPEISFMQSMGLWCVIDLIRFSKKKKDEIPSWLYIIDVFVNLVILLCLGLLIHSLC